MAETLGEKLSAARRAMGASLNDAEDATKIRGKLIEALEKGDYEALPDPAYVRGYIIGYAKFLDLDPAPLLAQFAQETGREPEREQIRSRDTVVAPREETNSVPWRTALIIAAVVALVALIIWGIGRLTGDAEEPAPLPATTETTPTAAETTVPPVSPTPEPTTTAPAVAEPFGVRVETAGDAASWLRVTVDGLVAYEGTLAGGQSKEFDVTDTCTIRIGKPSAVTIYRDGESVEIPPSAETPELTLTATDAPQ